MNVKIAGAPVSWGVWFASDPKQPPWERFLDEAVEAGYEWIELGPYGYLPTDLVTLRGELEKRRLKVVGTIVMAVLEEPSGWPALEEQVLGVGELLAGLSAKFLVLIDDFYSDLFTGNPTGPRLLDESAWTRLIDTTHRVADIAIERFGLRVAYHPHAETHVEYEDQIEAFLEQTDPERVSLCLDIGHHAYRGGDPVSFMRRHHQRVVHIHLKNVDKVIRERVKAESIPFGAAVGMGVFCEPSTGAVDFAAFRDVLREVDYDGWATVEHDLYPAPFDKPLPIAKRTLGYLRDIGIG